MAVIVCSICGHANNDDATFCDNCGSFLEWDRARVGEPAAPAQKAPDVPPAPAVVAEPEPAAPGTLVPVERQEPGGVQEQAGTVAIVSSAGVVGESPQPAASAPVQPEAADPLSEALSWIADSTTRLQRHGREDLAGHLERVRSRLLVDDQAVVVLGEFKKGKSSLVNGLVVADVCPVDADIVTGVPTIVRYGEAAEAFVHVAAQDDEEQTETEAIPLERVVDIVSEQRPRQAGPRPRAVEVRLNRRLLRGGVSLVDTPGVGGLDSEHGHIALSTLPLASAVLFVTDASQELTEPEMKFLRLVARRCDDILLVVTKTDLYPQWRRIVDLDRRHLAGAGLDVPVMAVSSFLRAHAGVTDDKALNEESGYPELVEWVRNTTSAKRTTVARAAAAEVGYALAHVTAQRRAEHDALTKPEQAPALLQGLQVSSERATKLTSSGARWQHVLNDGVQDLVSDVEHDLRERLRRVLRGAESIIDSSDPQTAWPEFELWLRRQVAAEIAENYDYLSRRADDLAREVLDSYDLDAADFPAVGAIAAPLADLEQIAVQGLTLQKRSSKRIADSVLALRGTYGGAAMVVMIGNIAGLSALLSLPLAVALGLGLGGRALFDEQKRQLEQRRQQARASLRKFMDDVGFVAGKHSRDALRRTQRQLRDDLTMRAQALALSTQRAMASARQAADLPDDERDRRAQEVAADLQDIDSVAQRAALVAAGARP